MKFPQSGDVVEVYMGPEGWNRAVVRSAASYQASRGDWSGMGVWIFAELADGTVVRRSGDDRKGYSFRFLANSLNTEDPRRKNSERTLERG